MVQHKRVVQKSSSNGIARSDSGSNTAKSNIHVVVPSEIVGASNPSTKTPLLPPLTDPTLLSATFTHAGTLSYSDAHRSDAHRHDLSYERLEFLGDAYIELFATRIIFDRFPDLRPGRLAQIRESLVNNWTLASFALLYAFDKRVRVPKEYNQRGKTDTKVYADVFEAYIAAIILQSPSTGFATAEKWMSELWASHLHKTTLVPELVCEAKQLLAKKILCKGITVEYKQSKASERSTEEKGKSNFFVDVYLTGWGYKHKRIGSGTGWSVGQAGSRAAMEALSDKALMDEISALKKEAIQKTQSQQKSES